MNTAYFHRVYRIKSIYKKTEQIRGNEVVLRNKTQIEKHILNYFIGAPNICYNNGIVFKIFFPDWLLTRRMRLFAVFGFQGNIRIDL